MSADNLARVHVACYISRFLSVDICSLRCFKFLKSCFRSGSAPLWKFMRNCQDQTGFVKDPFHILHGNA